MSSGHAYTAAGVRPRTSTAPARRSGAAPALALAAGCVAAMAVVWVLAELVAGIHYRDAVALHDFTLLDKAPIHGIANRLIHLLEPPLFILWGIALVAVALARERPRVAVAVAAVMALAPFSAEVLKPLLAHPHSSVGGTYIGPASWPSGHSTAALALVLCAVLVSPARLRPFTAVLGALYAAAVGVSLLILKWHMPSDVLGGFLLATFWAALAVAVLRRSDRLRPGSPPSL
ncbi:MAG TPA: phosphatase PAP2 family protein [Solirubrobacteraceae bacterium]|jgi:membrane-associated phospholipid phosphatase